MLNCLSNIDTDYSTDFDKSISDHISTDTYASIAVNKFDTSTPNAQGWIQSKQNSSLIYKKII